MRRPAPWSAVSILVIVLLAAPARADKVDDLARTLASDPSYKVRVQAALVLGKLGDKRAVAHLIKALKDQFVDCFEINFAFEYKSIKQLNVI